MPTCVGFGYGLWYLMLRGFSWKLGIIHFALMGSSSRLRIAPPDLPKGTPYTLKPGHPTPGRTSLLRLPIAVPRGTGILACFPSTTLFSLALGADSPYADERCVGNLGLSACGFFTRIIATHVSIRTSDTSTTHYQIASSAYGTLRYRVIRRSHPKLRCITLAPLHLRRRISYLDQ